MITLQRAEYRAREILNEAHDYDTPLRRDPKKATLGGFIQDVYAPWLRANRRRPDITLADLKRNFGSLYEKRLLDIDRDDFDSYVSASLGKGRAPATTRRSLNNLQRVVRLAVEKNYLRENPFKGWEKPKAEEGGAPRFLSDTETRLARRTGRARRSRAP